MRGKSHALFYICEEITLYIVVFINSMKTDREPPPKISFGFKDWMYWVSTISLGFWGGKVEPEEVNSSY